MRVSYYGKIILRQNKFSLFFNDSTHMCISEQMFKKIKEIKDEQKNSCVEEFKNYYLITKIIKK